MVKWSTNLDHPFLCLFCHADSKTVFLFNFWPRLGVAVKFDPPKSQGSPLMVTNLKKCWIDGLDSSKEGFWRTERNTKTSALCKVPFLKNTQKIGQNGNFWAILIVLDNFGQLFMIFSETILCRGLMLFALHSMHQTPSFELSKSTIH